MIQELNRVRLYIASKKQLCDDVFVYPKEGIISRESDGGYNYKFNEYIRDNKLYIVIDGVMYNKAKLIYDSVNKDNLPQKRYKVVVSDGDIAHPTISNIVMTDIRATEPIIAITDDMVNLIFDETDTDMNVEYLLKMLATRKYKVVRNEEV